MSIVVRELTRVYGSRRAVDRVSFEIPGPELVGLIGPNGAGKSTLLRMLATFLPPSSGSFQVAGCDGATDPRGIQQRLGYLPEQPPGQVEARVEEFLAFRAQLKGIDRRARPAEIDRCLEACQLRPVRRRLIGRLSLGYRRRVGLADALLGSPPVLLLDEPTIGFDPLQIRETRHLLAEQARRSIVVLSTHQLSDAEGVCGRVLIMLQGLLAADLATADLPTGQGFEVELAAPWPESERLLAGISGVTSVRRLSTHGDWHRFRVAGPDAQARELAAQLCLQRGWRLRELCAVRGTLEDHFVRLALRGSGEAA